jgi:hypothetical protein
MHESAGGSRLAQFFDVAVEGALPARVAALADERREQALRKPRHEG